MTSDPVVIRLELRVGGETVTGRASDGSGDARAFEGWLGLMAAIAALVPGASDADNA